MNIELKPCPLCASPVKWCGENETDPEDNHLCHHIQCTNPECRADFDFMMGNEEILPDDTDGMTAEECMMPFRIECAKRYNNRANPSGGQGYGDWIKCSERLPPSRTAVLVGCKYGKEWATKWATRIHGHPDASIEGWLIPGASWVPTHWQPLPSPPEDV